MHRSLFLVFSRALGVASYIRDKRGTRCVASNAPSSRERLVSAFEPVCESSPLGASALLSSLAIHAKQHVRD